MNATGSCPTRRRSSASSKQPRPEFRSRLSPDRRLGLRSGALKQQPSARSVCSAQAHSANWKSFECGALASTREETTPKPERSIVLMSRTRISLALWIARRRTRLARWWTSCSRTLASGDGKRSMRSTSHGWTRRSTSSDRRLVLM